MHLLSRAAKLESRQWYNEADVTHYYINTIIWAQNLARLGSETAIPFDLEVTQLYHNDLWHFCMKEDFKIKASHQKSPLKKL